MTAWMSHQGWERKLRPNRLDPTSCTGSFQVVDRSEQVWTVVCDGCGDELGVTARMADQDAGLQRHRTIVAQRLADSGIPELYRGTWASVADCEPVILAAARQLVADSNRPPTQERSGLGHIDAETLARAVGATAHGPAKRGLLLSGTVGAGKSKLAGATACALLEHRPVRWCFAPDLLGMLSADFGSDEFATASGMVRGTDALVLDDLDKAAANERGGRELLNAIEKRTSAGAPIVVTTNSTLDEIADRYPFGDAIASRLAGHCRAFRMVGPDRRLEGLAA